MLTQREALEVDEALQAIGALRENAMWPRVLAEIARRRDEHREAMCDLKLSPAMRCEHITAWEDAQALTEFLEKEEARMRAALREHDDSEPFIDRKW